LITIVFPFVYKILFKWNIAGLMNHLTTGVYFKMLGGDERVEGQGRKREEEQVSGGGPGWDREALGVSKRRGAGAYSTWAFL
jgi:hypothetical protein